MKQQQGIIPILTEKNLSKEQKAFNSKVRKINKLKKEIADFKVYAPEFKAALHTEVTPLQKDVNKLKAQIVEKLAELYEHKPLGGGNKSKKLLREFISEQSFSLIQESKFTHLIPIFERFSSENYQQVVAQQKQDTLEEMNEMFEAMGIKFRFDEADDMENPEEVARKMQQVREEAERIQAEAQAQKEAKKAKREQKKNAKKPQDAPQVDLSVKSLKEIYTELVKQFHPDSETDIEKKAFRTEIMKKITTAYEAKDLFGLLQIQLESNLLNKDKLNEIPTEKIRAFIGLLDQQISHLLSELHTSHIQLTDELRSNKLVSDFIDAPEKYNKIVLSAKAEKHQELKSIEHDLSNLENPKYVRHLLEEWRQSENMRMIQDLFDSF